MFQKNISDLSNHKILSLKQVIQRLPIALEQEKVGSTSENLINEIREVIYSLHQEKENTNNVYNNIMIVIKV